MGIKDEPNVGRLLAKAPRHQNGWRTFKTKILFSCRTSSRQKCLKTKVSIFLQFLLSWTFWILRTRRGRRREASPRQQIIRPVDLRFTVYICQVPDFGIDFCSWFQIQSFCMLSDIKTRISVHTRPNIKVDRNVLGVLSSRSTSDLFNLNYLFLLLNDVVKQSRWRFTSWIKVPG